MLLLAVMHIAGWNSLANLALQISDTQTPISPAESQSRWLKTWPLTS